MWKAFYENSELLELPLASMFMFMLSFAGALYFGFRRTLKNDPRAGLPLLDDDVTHLPEPSSLARVATRSAP